MLEFLQSLGPYSAPINVVLFAGLIWLSKDRTRILTALAAAQFALGVEKDKRADVMERNYKEFMERGEAMARMITDFNSKAQQLLERER